MKHLLVILIFVFTITGINAQTVGSITVEIKAGKLSINKANVTDGWRQDIVSVTLNGNDRRRPGFNTTHSYDKLGIVLFEKNDDKLPSGILSEIQFYFKVDDSSKVAAKEVFTGKMKIENFMITPNLTPEALKKNLKNYTETDSYMPHNFRLAYMGLYIYLKFNDEETFLQKISIGKDMR